MSTELDRLDRLTNGQSTYAEAAASEDHDCATLEFISEGVEIGDDEGGLLVWGDRIR